MAKLQLHVPHRIGVGKVGSRVSAASDETLAAIRDCTELVGPATISQAPQFQDAAEDRILPGSIPSKRANTT